jgi:multidrug resistance efflux pump
MSIAFFRSAHELEGDTAFQSITVLVISALLIALWMAWLCLARIPVYRTADSVMLLMSTGYEADAAVSGRIVAVNAVLGQEVHAGDVLVEVYPGGQESQLEEARAQWNGAEAAWRTDSEIARKYAESQAVISQVDVLRARAQAEADHAKADGLRFEIKRR